MSKAVEIEEISAATIEMCCLLFEKVIAIFYFGNYLSAKPNTEIKKAPKKSKRGHIVYFVTLFRCFILAGKRR